MDRGRRLDSLLPLLRRRALERDPLLRPRRHGRQSADEPGSRVARGPGLVRPSPVPAESAHWRQHPLVAVRRPADRRHHPCSSPVRRRSGGGARRGRHRADAAAAPAALLAGADRAAADRPPGLSARLRRLVLRRIGGRNVHADADRSPRLAARLARARGRRNGRPETRARRRSDGHRIGHVAVDRPRNADLHRDHGGGGDPVLGDRSAISGGACRPMRWRWAAARPSASSSSPPTPTAFPSAMLFRRYGFRMRCWAARCCSAQRCFRPPTGSDALRLPPAPESSWPSSTALPGRNACRVPKACRRKWSTCG